MDDSYTNRQFRVLIGLQFAQRLDPARLESSLNQLLTADEDWLKLTGRLRLNTVLSIKTSCTAAQKAYWTILQDKKLELHIPSSFSAARPAVRFSLNDHPYSLEESPLAEFLPRQTEDISITVDPERYRSLYQSPDIPKTLQAYLQGDVPVLSVHVTCFTNATFVGVLIPHVIADAASFGLFFQGWADVLQGKPAPKLVSYKEDRMAQSVMEVKSGDTPAIVEKFALPWLQEMIFIFWMLVNIIRQWHINIVDIYIPAKVIRKWREESMAELGGAWISEGDVLTAWLIQVHAAQDGSVRDSTNSHCDPQHRLPDLRKDVSAWIIADTRGRLPLVPKNYWGNAVMPLLAHLPGRTSIASVGARIRRTIMAQTTPEELAKEVDFINRYRKARGRDGIVAVAGTDLYVVTNWTRANLHGVDFSGALAGASKTSEAVLPVGASRLGYAAIPVRSMAWIICKDQHGGYFVQCQVPKAGFETFKAAVLASGETCRSSSWTG
jgi:hypothetical protein